MSDPDTVAVLDAYKVPAELRVHPVTGAAAADVTIDHAREIDRVHWYRSPPSPPERVVFVDEIWDSETGDEEVIYHERTDDEMRAAWFEYLNALRQWRRNKLKPGPVTTLIPQPFTTEVKLRTKSGDEWELDGCEGRFRVISCSRRVTW